MTNTITQNNIQEYEPELRPEYIKKLQRIMKGKYYTYDSIEAARKDIQKEEKSCSKSKDLY